ncbi:MAG: aryl-sulfate sulfotransferase [Alphaproteobacteria bacterium]|nr:MAG: aryl-sulfate sulfotransferase [Alphaproteobacteria bacterium]
MPAMIVKHSVRIAGHQTSISLERKFWEMLREIARREKRSINDLVTEIDETRSGNMSSAIRLYVLDDLLSRLGEKSGRG